MLMRKIGWATKLAGKTSSGATRDLPVADLTDEVAMVLGAAGIPDTRKLTADILAALLDVPRSWIVLNKYAPLDADLARAAHVAARRLAAGAPFAYAVGSAQFRQLNLAVDSRVLIPRPETEVLVGEILSRFCAMRTVAADWGVAVDIGTGSGAIALSLATEGHFARVIATDSSLDALDVARRNATLASPGGRCPVEFRCGSLIGPVRGVTARLLVSNPPYIAFGEAEQLPPSVRNWEPPTALLSGSSGLDATAAIVQGGVSLLESGGLLALEVDARRASLVADMVMAETAYVDIGVVLDLTGRERFVFASRA
jgi:release factor glutamine methyltransferase